MKIIVLGTRGFPNIQGGVESHCEHLYPCLADLGCTITVITRLPYVDPSAVSYRGVRLMALACPQNKFLEAFIHTFKGVWLARTLGCDVLHVHAIGPSLFVPLARLLGLRVVMTNHGPDYERKKWNVLAKIILRIGEWNGVVFSNQIIAISRTIADQIKKTYNRSAVQIPNGVVVPPVIATDGALKKFGLEKGQYILAVGRFVPEKGFDDLIDAYLNDKSLYARKIKLVIVGDADHPDAYSARLKNKADPSKGVVCTGRLAGIALKEIYAHAKLFVLPSYYEGLPIVLLEALSYGLSCLVSDIPANKEIELEEDRYFSVGNVDDLGRKMAHLCTRPTAEKEKNLQIRRIAENYNWKKIAASTFHVYDKAIQ